MKRCPHFPACGGCQLQHLSYNEQVNLKIEKLVRIFGFEPEEIYKSPKEWYYRNRMDYVVGPGYKVGLKKRGTWWKIIDLKECYLMSPEANEIKNEFREFIREKGLEPWDTRIHKGFVRYIVIREGKFTNERQVQIIVSREEYEIFKEFYERIRDKVTSFIVGINSGVADVSYADKYIPLFGSLEIKEKILDYTYYICPKCFFQSNSYTAEILLKKVLEFAGEGKICYDLYCGVGFFTIPLANKFDEVIGVEEMEEAIKMLEKNKEINDVRNIKGIASKVEKLEKIRADVVIVDPPRSGLHPKAVKLLLFSDVRKIIYVSCNPETQYRDIEMLKDKYELERYIFVDQFPQTEHIETIAILKRKE